MPLFGLLALTALAAEPLEVVVGHGHSGPVWDVRFVGDGRVASAAGDGTARLWDLASGRELLLIDDAHAVNDSVTCSIPVGELLITCGVDGFVRAWSQSSGKLVKEVKAPVVHITAADVTVDGKLLAVSSGTSWQEDRVVTLYALPSMTKQGRFKVASDHGHVYDMAFSPDGNSLALGMNTVQLVNLRGKPQWPPSRHGDGYVSLVFTPDGSKVLAVSEKLYEVYDTATGDTLLSGEHNPSGDSFVTDVAMHPDGKLFTTGDLTQTLDVRRLEDGSLVHRFEIPQGQGTEKVHARTVAFSDDGSHLAAGTWHSVYGGDLRIWSMEDYQQVRHIGGPAVVEQVRVSRDGRWLTTNGVDGIERRWDLHVGRVVEDSQKSRIDQLLPGAPGTMPFAFKDRKGNAYKVPLVVPEADFIVDYSDEEFLRRPVLVDPDTLEILFAFPTDDVNAMTASADGQRLFLGRVNGTIEVWDPHQRVLVATLTGYQNDWAAFLPDGTYAVSRTGLDMVYFRRGEELMPFDSFDLLYNRPDRLLEALGTSTPEIIGAYRAAAEKRLRRMGLEASALDSEQRVPELAVTTKAPLETEAKSLTLALEGRDRRDGLQRLHVWVNGVPVLGLPGVAIEGKTWSDQVEVPLAHGANRIEVAVQNGGGIQSHRQVMTVNRSGDPPPRTLKVLAVGVSDYPEEDFDLSYAAKDARDVAAWFDKAEGFDSVELLTLVDEQATAQGIREARTFLEETTADDQVVLFFAGHGVLDQDGAYRFGTHDADLLNFGEGGLSFDEVETLVDGIPAHRRLLLIDTCHAGELDEDAVPRVALGGGSVKTRAVRGLSIARKKRAESQGPTTDVFALMKETFADLRQSTGSAVIASSGGAEFAFESPSWDNGVFTYALLEGLSTAAADLNNDGAIKVLELRKHVAERVQELTGGQQTPAARQENLVLDFTVR